MGATAFETYQLTASPPIHVHVMGALMIGDQDDLALTRHNLLHVGNGLLEHSVMGRDHDHRHEAHNPRVIALTVTSTN